MAEVLGQRTLLGFGVVLAWLVLFHLLVNIWLLCVFTSLLVVFGGWLGSQAILESKSVIHLERFITMEQIPNTVEDEQLLDNEIRHTVKKIIRDFVSSWYCTISTESNFEMEVQEAMISMGMELKKRAKQVDRKELTQGILNLFGCHLQDYLRAKELMSEQLLTPNTKGSSDTEQLWTVYSKVTTPHPAMDSGEVQLNYTRTLVDILLHVLVPSTHLETRTGRWVVGELITCNVFLPLIAKLSDPDWLNLFLIDIFDGTEKVEETTVTDSPSSSLSPLPAESQPPLAQETTYVPQNDTEVLLPKAQTEKEDCGEQVMSENPINDGTDSDEVDFKQNIIEEDTTQPFLSNFIRGRKSNPFYQENDSDLDSPLGEYKQSYIDSLVMIDQEEGFYDSQKEHTSVESNNDDDLEDVPDTLNGSCPQDLVRSDLLNHSNGCGPSLESTTTGTPISSLQNLEVEVSSPSTNPARELLLGVQTPGSGNANELAVVSPLQGSSPMLPFSFEPLSSPDGPVIIQNLRITGTITAKEHRGTGSHPYTLYTIKYETAVVCENSGSIQSGSEDAEALQTGCESPSPLQPVAYHMVNRRYSEFLNLQTRLEDKPELKKLIKGVKGPKKIFPDMPFGNMDSDRIEARKGLLETFLKHLCIIPEIANSEQMQEFLALNTDARIAFVKKPFIVSRIDKIVVNAIVDTLKTAFPRSEPQSPTEDTESEIDGGKTPSDKKSKSRLKFSSKSVPFMNGSDMKTPVLFSCEQTGTVFNGMSLEDLQIFMSKQENLAATFSLKSGDSTVRESRGHPDDTSSVKHSEEHDETALAEVAMNILCLVMREQWSWLCTDNIQRTIRLLFGTLINSLKGTSSSSQIVTKSGSTVEAPKWVDVTFANLTCTSYWVGYLQGIQEAVWPGGTLPTAPQIERSQQQKDHTKQQALHCLMKLLPDLVSDLLGSEKYKVSWQTVLDSFQEPNVNRHLVFCIFDLLLEFLVPEIPEQGFQRSLLQNLSKNPEKLLA